MSEYERSKESRQKKYFFSANKPDRKDLTHGGQRRLPIILTKPERDGDKERAGGSSKPVEKPIQQPTIILRTREGENRAVSPSQRPTSVTRKDSDVPAPVYQLAAKHGCAESVNPLAPPPEMKTSVKLIDETLQISDGCLEYLIDQNDYLVVGCLGMQGVGKSTIMSLLAGNKVEHTDKMYFKPQSAEQLMLGCHGTVGVDLFVTSDRVIMLDTQPILSASIMDRISQQEGKKFTTSDFTGVDNAMEIQSLQIAAFLFSVCHLVIFIQDWFFDPNLLRFIQSAEMLKPATPTTSQDEEIVEYFPHLLFLQNKAPSSYFSPSQVNLIQSVYNRTFLRSRLLIQSGLGISTGNIINCLTPSSCGEAINLFILPDFSEPEIAGHYKGHPGFSTLLGKLKNQILGVARNPLSHSLLSEKNWYLYAWKVWDSIRKSSFFLEYNRLLP